MPTTRLPHHCILYPLYPQQIALQNGETASLPDGNPRADLRPFHCFAWNNRIYRYEVLPFGLATAPRTFSKAMRALIDLFRQRGIKCTNYLDDFLFFLPDDGRSTRTATRDSSRYAAIRPRTQ